MILDELKSFAFVRSSRLWHENQADAAARIIFPAGSKLDFRCQRGVDGFPRAKSGVRLRQPCMGS